MSVSLTIDQHELTRLVDEFSASEVIVRRALQSTISKMGRWLRTRAGRAVRQETGIDFKLLRKRFRAVKFKKTPNGGIGGAWIGLNPIDLKNLAPVQDASGVAAGPSGKRRDYQGAFMGPRPGVTASKLKGRVFKRAGSSRLPIKKQEYDIQAEGEKAIQSDVMEYHKFEMQFFTVFERELKWRTSTLK